MAIGESIGQTFDLMYFFERGCKNLITALSSGRELHVISDDVARKTAAQWEEYDTQGAGEKHLGALTAILDEEGADYRD